MRPVFQWRLERRVLELGKRTLIMGILNVTPDSFSDGGKFLDRDQAVEQGEKMLADGADMIDVGGESTRPGVLVASADPGHEGASAKGSQAAVSAEQEMERVIPVIRELKNKRPEVLISVDTYKASVARAAAGAGAEIVNDVSGLCWDREMAPTVAELKCGLVLMHMRGRPDEWRTLPPLDDVVGLVVRELRARADCAIQAGVGRERIVLDPGFGFGKKFGENYPLIARFDEFQKLGFPLLVGTSRKSFIGRTLRTLDRDLSPDERLFGTIATETALILKGAHIVRTHDVKASVEAAKVADAILQAGQL
jgi:dihydropteroate synthase